MHDRASGTVVLPAGMSGDRGGTRVAAPVTGSMGGAHQVLHVGTKFDAVATPSALEGVIDMARASV